MSLQFVNPLTCDGEHSVTFKIVMNDTNRSSFNPRRLRLSILITKMIEFVACLEIISLLVEIRAKPRTLKYDK